jgi:hypothetical protein
VATATEPGVDQPTPKTYDQVFDAFRNAGHGTEGVTKLLNLVKVLTTSAAANARRDPQVVERVRAALERDPNLPDCIAQIDIPGGAVHRTLDAVAKDDALPAPGSLHEALNRLFLGSHPELEGCTIMHSFAGRCVATIVPLTG